MELWLPGMGMTQLTRILAVEEDPAFRGILLDLLRPVAATRLAAAADLAEGLELLGREEWDAMVLGLNLGGQYGSGAVEEIRCLTPTLPLLVLPPSVDSKVAFAFSLRAALVRCADSWHQRGYTLGFGSGIAQGESIMGAIGHEQFVHYTAISSTVNLAARLCQKAQVGQILTTARAMRPLEGRLLTEPVATLDLKGIEQPVKAVNLLGWR